MTQAAANNDDNDSNDSNGGNVPGDCRKDESDMKYFTEILKIPRASGNEGAIAQYIYDLAKARGLFCVKDEHNNVFVRKSAAKGYEDGKPVLLQAHTDMVCEKTADSDHDFSRDPITPIIENGRVRADKTTLGADDGAGVAVMLRLIDEDIPTVETEYLFTSSEETGMDGAFGFDYSLVHAEKVINLDSDEELSACIGCAGNITESVEIPLKNAPADGAFARLEVFGLCGGHSGTEIDKGRASAIKVLGSALDAIYEDMPFGMVTLTGGGRDNVIPFSASAVLCLYGKSELEKAKERVDALKKELAFGMIKEDRARFGIRLTKVKESERAEMPANMLTFKSTSAVISAITLSPQGVIDRYPGSGEVMTSVNLGRVSAEGGRAELRYLIRSARDARMLMVKASIDRLAHALGGLGHTVSRCTGWEGIRGSELQTAYGEACEAVFGRSPTYTVVHAGLECGIISAELSKRGGYPDIISIGADVTDIHSPKESMGIESLGRLYEVVKGILNK